MSVVAFIVAALRAIPALQSLFAQVSEEISRQNNADAINRKAVKDAEVDTAIGDAVRVHSSSAGKQP